MKIALSLACCLSFVATLPAADLNLQPRSLTFGDAFAGAQLLVNKGDRDLTREVAYTSSNPNVVAVDAKGYATPTGDGKATITVRQGSQTATLPVTVTGFLHGRAVDFRTEVQPLLSKLGCNSGGCHGKASGQNGFKLSLFGFDAELDYNAIVKEGRGRRLFPASADDSLFLAKATGRLPHGGGKKLKPGTSNYHTLYQWVAAGAPASAPEVPHVTGLRMVQRDAILKRGQSQQLAVIAEYSDGSHRDVTRQSEYASNLDVVASVDAEGFVRANDHSGEAAIMARHLGFVAVFLALVPHADSLKQIPDFPVKTEVDRLAVEKWKKLGLKPSPLADDSTFLRRVTLDLCGRLPTADEVKTFLADKTAEKRSKVIDRLLDSPDYPAYFAMKWGSILRNSNLAGADQASYAFHNWIKDNIARNRPYDEFVRRVVAAAGEWQDAPAINWYWQNRDDQLHMVTADVAQIFLGVRLQCAKCHHHPYERWGQADYYGLAGFFTRLGRKNFGQPPPYYASATPTTGERNPLTGKTPEPKYLDGIAPKFTPEEDPRHALVDWMAKPENPFFSRAMANRMWGHFLGRGLYDQVDDLRDTNPPSNPELLDYLSHEFVKSKFDVKHLIRLIVNSRVYQLSSDPTESNRHDSQNYARFYARRLPAEVFLDAVNTTCGTKGGFNNIGSNARAVDLPHEGFGSYFLDTFDRPKRVTVCECERSSSATLGQVLLLANSDEMENKIADGNGRVAQIKERTPHKLAIEEIYLVALGRPPNSVELNRHLAYVEESPDKKKGLEDVLWAVLNCKEFMFNR